MSIKFLLYLIYIIAQYYRLCIHYFFCFMFARDAIIFILAIMQASRFFNRGLFCATLQARNASSVPAPLYKAVADLGEVKQAQLKLIKTQFGEKSLGETTVSMAIGGMRGIKGMITETSDLDELKGITFRGHTIDDLRAKLPTAPGGNEPLPEGLLWLLLTGKIPTTAEVKIISDELAKRQELPAYLVKIISDLPADMHPMTQLVAAVAAAGKDSEFMKGYHAGMKKNAYWEKSLDDGLTLIAQIPNIAALIYRKSFRDGKAELPVGYNKDLDWAGNFAKNLGFQDEKFAELMRLYLTIHADHEGGNVSAHATHLVGSALADPFLSFSAGLAGLAGPLHGLANQECLKWILETHAQLNGRVPTPEIAAQIAKDTLASGRVVPGFGHAVLRATDPRYMAQRAFAEKNLPENELFKLVDACFRGIPPVLQATGKVKNPFPNVDAHSGILLHHYGMKEADYYTVLFGVSRAIGCVSQLVWSRILGFPIERPKSLTLDFIEKKFSQ